MVLVKRLLQRMQLVGARRDALDGEEIVAVRLHGEHQARARRAAVHQDRAGAAYAVLAAEMGAGEAELMADEIRERDADLHFLLVALAVDRQRDLAGLAHMFLYIFSSLLGVMAGLVPAIHVLLAEVPQERRGCPPQARA